MTKIRDLYVGKPDAHDEISYEGYSEFMETFVVPENFNINDLVDGDTCFITGFKGTGKTALLFYLEELLKRKDNVTCSSFVFFKEEYTELKKIELESMAKKIRSSISIEKEGMVEDTEFEYIWRWLFFKRIIIDNIENSNNLFENDEHWKKFESLINRIKMQEDKKFFPFISNVNFSIPVSDQTNNYKIEPDIEIGFKHDSNKNNNVFVNIIEQAEKELVCSKRTDIPYYIFVDELEAYYGNEKVFFRDLKIIRDMVFTIKRLNTIFKSNNFVNTKIFCSVRTEILGAISKFIETKELNKVINGFSIQLRWNYNNTTSYKHPIMQILLKRIAMVDKGKDTKDVYKDWFPEKIHDLEPCIYILNQTWSKPRDIVNMLTAAKSSIHNDLDYFSQLLLDSISKEYSYSSLSEIKEELQALYKPNEVETIINCFTGFQSIFSYSELIKRIKKFFPNTIMDENTNQVLRDLYRLGFLGNYMPEAKTHRWQHKGDEEIIIDDNWNIEIHLALKSILSLNSRQDYIMHREKGPGIGYLVKAKVIRCYRTYAYVTFEYYDAKYNGRITIKEFGRKMRKHINELIIDVPIGSEWDVYIDSYNQKFDSWILVFKKECTNIEEFAKTINDKYHIG